MISVTLPDGFRIGIVFRYNHVPTGIEGHLAIDRRMVPTRETYVEIIHLDENGRAQSEPPLAVGYVRCDSRDNFNRELGRKRALTRALFYSFFDRSERAVIWNAYHARGASMMSEPKAPTIDLEHEVARME